MPPRRVRDAQERLPPRVEAIVRQVAAMHDITRDDVMSSRRFATMARARQYAIWLIRNMPTASGKPHSTTQIGSWFGMDHTTVVYALQKIDRERGYAGPV